MARDWARDGTAEDGCGMNGRERWSRRVGTGSSIGVARGGEASLFEGDDGIGTEAEGA